MSTVTTPQLYIAGFTKCATSSLHDWLVQHPKVMGGFQKELEFLYDEDSYFFRPERSVLRQGLDGYAALYGDVAQEDAILLDATPAYAHHKTARETIAAMPSKPLVLFVTRDPVDQILSTYHYFSNNKLYIDPAITIETFFEMVIDGRATTAFEQDHLKNALDWACFDYWLALWARDIGADHIMTFDMRDMVKKPQTICDTVFEKMGLTPFQEIDFAGANETYFVKSRTLQRLNTLVRGLIPKGALYAGARKLYRALNTNTAKPDQSTHLQELKLKLAQRIAERQTELLRFL